MCCGLLCSRGHPALIEVYWCSPKVNKRLTKGEFGFHTFEVFKKKPHVKPGASCSCRLLKSEPVVRPTPHGRQISRNNGQEE